MARCAPVSIESVVGVLRLGVDPDQCDACSLHDGGYLAGRVIRDERGAIDGEAPDRVGEREAVQFVRPIEEAAQDFGERQDTNVLIARTGCVRSSLAVPPRHVPAAQDTSMSNLPRPLILFFSSSSAARARIRERSPSPKDRW